MRIWKWLVVLGLLFVGLDFLVSTPVGNPPRPRMYGSTHGFLVFGVLTLMAGLALSVAGALTKSSVVKRGSTAASKVESER